MDGPLKKIRRRRVDDLDDLLKICGLEAGNYHGLALELAIEFCPDGAFA
jgi:hypothetical protein